ncbi:MAG: GNAT family N-acetyltransferase [Gammaproteobacteria bacterium]|nr:GNAT family N-acetyltransferase [Gammaproteobacteria bacterium]
MKIRKAKVDDAIQCLECVKNSQLWDAYFKDEPTAEKIEEEIRKNGVTVSVDDQDKCIGFMGINETGCFGKFPYLEILCVHENYRNKGIGKELLRHFENLGFEKEDRVFLLCSDFNEKGRKFYKENGYIECGNISDLYKKGIAEYFFVKYKDEN